MDVSTIRKIRNLYAIENILFLGKGNLRIYPGMDLIVARDVFTRLPLTQVLDAIEEIKASGAKYLLTTTFLNRTNKQLEWNPIWNPICLFNAPFRFPQPLELISEQCMMTFPDYLDKSLGLWRVADLPTYIPRHIIQCWHSKELPPLLDENCARIRRAHPGFRHTVFSFDDCEAFLGNFDPKVLRAYQNLIPSAYKCDLLRYCILYVYGGIYFDISFELNSFNFLEVIHAEHFSTEVAGLVPYGDDPYKGVSNGLMILHPKNKIMKQTIYAIVDNVEKQFYGRGVYDITGAVLLGSFFTVEEKKKLVIKRQVTMVSNRLTSNGWSLHSKLILKRMEDYDRGLPGRTGQTYIKHWWDKTVFKSTT